jgi:RPA family protein
MENGVPGMTALIRIFAGELAVTTLQQDAGIKHSPLVIISPSGACGSYLLLAGALTRVEKIPGDFLRAWVSDPTGTFTLVLNRQDEGVCAFLEHADPPVFILATGELQVSRGSKKEVQIRPLTIRAIDRLIRDSWIIRTSEQTLKRLEIMESAIRDGKGEEATLKAIDHYHVGTVQITSLVTMVEEALSKVEFVPGGEIKLPDPREVLLELIKINSGPKGISISELVPLAAGKGIREDQVIGTIRQLVEEDECYQPAAGAVKLL